MRKFASLLLALLTACSIALAETAWPPLPMTNPDDPDAALDVLPHAPDPANFTDETYEDATISVQMEHVKVGEAMFNVARVKLSDASQFRTEVEPPYQRSQTNLVATMAARQNAVVAIGGDNYKGGEQGYILRQGRVMRAAKAGSRDLLFVDANGDFTILRAPANEDVTALLEGETPVIHSFCFGPALVIDGELQTFDKYKWGNINRNEPRCAIGQTGPLEYLLVVVDGRGMGDSEGCDGQTLANFMLEQGCVQAYNLDGGNSADMYFNGGVYSYQKKNPRALSDIIYFATLVDAGLDTEAAE